jgi:[acyl-carrier-protein] S-malonyltransferase
MTAAPTSDIRHQTSDFILCPGQGAQHLGMGKAWVAQSDSARKIFDAADVALGFDLSRVCFEGPEESLNGTDVAQAAIYTTSVACFEALRERGTLDPTAMAATAGLSLGEFTALHLAGAFDFLTGLRLVRLRGQAMQEAALASPSGMVALVGADEAQALAVCEEALNDPENKGDEVMVPANFNCPGQVVISGSQAACERAQVVASRMGLRATALVVAGAFHSPLMQPAADRLAEALDAAEWHVPRVPVLSNVTAQPHDGRDINSIKQRLVEQLTKPVRWSESMQWAAANLGTDRRYVELAPGKVLSGLMRRIDRNVKVENHAQPE